MIVTRHRLTAYLERNVEAYREAVRRGLRLYGLWKCLECSYEVKGWIEYPSETRWDGFPGAALEDLL